MFTGIVADVGTVVEAGGARLRVRSGLLRGAEMGASVSVDGCCLTVTSIEDDACRFDLSTETVRRTTLGERRTGDRVNLERPVRAGAELGGHVVQGHVDGVGRVEAVDEEQIGRTVTVAVEPVLGRYLAVKGSVTVDGVSMTVAACDLSSFAVALVPHTLEVTTLGALAPGRRVNVEVDVLAKYVERLVAPYVRAAASAPGDDSGYL